MRDKLDKKHKVTVVNNGENFHFVPSNPWVGVKWRERKQIEFPVRSYLERKGIEFISTGVNACIPTRTSLSSTTARCRLRLSGDRHRPQTGV
jgi:sulfide:quinone oxidoreductase